MTADNLEEAFRQAVARRARARMDRATSCLPFLVDSRFRAHPPLPEADPCGSQANPAIREDPAG